MKHPQRQCMDIDTAAEYIKWVIEQPKGLAINEISIDPMQDKYWNEE
jgi:NADP-dependent 3-hydroxy acid dehydrogenase YdfG